MKLWKCTTFLLLGLLMAGVVPARASEEGRRNTAIALTAGALAAFAKDKDTIGLGLTAGSAYAWKRYSDARDARKKRQAAAPRTRSAPVYSYSGRTSSSRPAARLASYPTSQRRSGTASSSRGQVASQSALAAQKAELARLKTDYAAQQKKQQELQAQLTALQTRTAEMEQKQQQSQTVMTELAEENRKLREELQQQQKSAGSAWVWTLAGLGPLGLLGLWSGLRQLRRYRFQVVPVQGA